MKKKRYTKPQTETILLRGPVVMLGGSNTVQEFGNGGDVLIGDYDD